MKVRNIWILRMLAVTFVVLLSRPGLIGAQSFPRKPLPPKKDAAAVAAALSIPSSPSWQLLTNQPPVLNYVDCGPGNPLLLTDGTVMLADDGCQDWWKLTPDEFGSYVNGTWTELASTPAGYSPLYHSSAVLPDGRVIIEGGEYNFLMPAESTLGAIYDPLTNTWTSVAPPSFFGGCCGYTQTIGDAQSVVLFDGTYMQADCCTKQAALLNPRTLTWMPTGSGKFDINSEEGWNLLPNGDVLTVDVYVGSYDPTGKNSELYNPRTGEWSSAGSTIAQLWGSGAACGGESASSFEIGPAVLRPDGNLFYTGANPCGPANTANYNWFTGKWTPGPVFPDDLDIADGPASIEPNGKVLMMASPYTYLTPSTFLEYDGRNLTQIPAAPNAQNDSSYYGNMLVLPTGQILFTDFYFVSVYNPTGGYNPAWAPVVFFAPQIVHPGASYVTFGYLFNGLSQGASYGDDAQAATNYPLVRIKNKASGHVFYSRTHDHSSMGVGFFDGLVSTHFDVPATQEKGFSELVVVTNGIPSTPVDVFVK